MGSVSINSFSFPYIDKQRVEKNCDEVLDGVVYRIYSWKHLVNTCSKENRVELKENSKIIF